MEIINALGRRKSAVARVYLSEASEEGKGKIIINKREFEQYFPSSILQYVVLQPLNLLEVAGKYNIKVNLKGGGYTGQSQALRAEGFMTRDSREVERKKPGRPKARRRFQFSKR